MNLRIFYLLTNIETDDTDNELFKLIKDTDNKNKELFFNDGTLNVLSQDSYKKVMNYKYMYGVALKSTKNIITHIKKLFSSLNTLFPDIEVIYDTGAGRYINKSEFLYYTQNIFPHDKIFNIDVQSTQFKTTYKTKGLETIGHPEIKMYSNTYYSADILKTFKKYIIECISSSSFPLLMIREECNVIDEEELLSFELTPNRDLNIIYAKHLVDNYKIFYELFTKFKNNNEFEFLLNGKTLDNNSTLEDYSSINYVNYSNFISSYEIKHKDITYNHINIFYATKYL